VNAVSIPKSIFEVIEFSDKSANIENDFGLYMGDFLDHVNRLDKLGVKEAVINEPVPHESIPMWCYSYVSAVAHHLSHNKGIDISEREKWFNNKKYVLSEPYFPCGLRGDIQIILLAESPVEFRIKNLFVSSNALARV